MKPFLVGQGHILCFTQHALPSFPRHLTCSQAPLTASHFGPSGAIAISFRSLEFLPFCCADPWGHSDSGHKKYMHTHTVVRLLLRHFNRKKGNFISTRCLPIVHFHSISSHTIECSAKVEGKAFCSRPTGMAGFDLIELPVRLIPHQTPTSMISAKNRSVGVPFLNFCTISVRSVPVLSVSVVALFRRLHCSPRGTQTHHTRTHRIATETLTALNRFIFLSLNSCDCTKNHRNCTQRVEDKNVLERPHRFERGLLLGCCAATRYPDH